MTAGWPLSGDRQRQRKLAGIAIAEAGDPVGEPVVFLHGIGSAGRSFDAQLAHFAQSHWCVAPDAPGYGDSDDDLAISSMDDFADRWARLLDDLDVERAIVVGMSWGGVMAARLAASHPERVRALILADSSRGSGRNKIGAAAMRSRLDDLAREGLEAFCAARSPRLVSAGAPSELVQRVVQTMAESIRLPGYRQAVEAMATTDNTITFRAITAPTLVLVGAEDVVTPPAESALISKLIPEARLCQIPDAGHLANQEQPEAFNRALHDFLDKITPAAVQPVIP